MVSKAETLNMNIDLNTHVRVRLTPTGLAQLDRYCFPMDPRRCPRIEIPLPDDYDTGTDIGTSQWLEFPLWNLLNIFGTAARPIPTSEELTTARVLAKERTGPRALTSNVLEPVFVDGVLELVVEAPALPQAIPAADPQTAPTS